MDFRVQLLHADAQQRVVLVQAFEAERCVGSALGEAANAEEAEDRALERLRHRLQGHRSPSLTPFPSKPSKTPSSLLTTSALPPSPQASPSPPVPLSPASPSALSPPSPPVPAAAAPEAPDPAADPEDWGADLTEVDRLLRHLGWGREQERIFMERLLGYPSRSRLTRYADLMLLRRALEALPAGSEPGHAPIPLRRSDLLSQCDGLLDRLGWTTDQARQCLEKHFAATSRQHLPDEQLLAFNLLLEGELLEGERLEPSQPA